MYNNHPSMESSNLSDEQLICEIREGKTDLYGEIVKRYQNKLFNYLFRLCGDRTESEDILQNVFIKAYKNLYGFDAEKKFSSWIYRIAHNEAVNHIKKISREKKVPLEDVVFSLPDKGDGLEDMIDKKVLKEMVAECLEKVDMKYREPLILYFFEERSYEEISDILRVPASTVGTLIFRGKKAVKNVYDNYGK